MKIEKYLYKFVEFLNSRGLLDIDFCDYEEQIHDFMKKEFRLKQ